MLPTIVLVHGAFAESASWDGVVDPLVAAGHDVIAAATPLGGLATDAQSVRDLVRTVEGPVVLATHSYSGAVMSNAEADAGDIVARNGFTPDAAESAFQLAGMFPGSMLGETTLRPVPRSDGTTDLYITRDSFHEVFCPDVPAPAGDQNGCHATTRHTGSARRALRRATAVEGAAVVFPDRRERSRYPARSPALHGQARRRAPHDRYPGASHAALVSQPCAVADLILEAARVPAAA